jgi:spoIIIJ-associated protein
MGLDFPVTMEETRDAGTFRITGDGSGILIGKGGQTLDAIQYVVNKAVGVSGEDRRRIVLDTEEYRGRREDYLVSLAAKLADKVKKTHKPITVNYMNARDRRIIHLALKGDVELVTKSRGEGSYRKIVILPAKRNGNRRALLKNQDT